ncbi:MAG: S-methyl-5-thioribose-1-phosphate isomerase [Deltaproteobacteria bacterium]|jgi:methylthioribose-1-phosphate isomerase|nr:S-methyl-5-thioribose-1-phosphate isomerase [Deltaproteobacteria bacterium]
MLIANKPRTSLWYDEKADVIRYLDQTLLPWELKIREMRTVDDAVRAIRDMEVRGAPLIGVAAAFGYYLGLRAYGLRFKEKEKEKEKEIVNKLISTRPTAVNLKWALGQMRQASVSFAKEQLESGSNGDEREYHSLLLQKALDIRQSEIDRCFRIGQHGLRLIEELAGRKKDKPVNILTHCNAGWLATIDYGTATAPIYLAHDAGIPVHVWVDETRPRNQGAKLTAYELSQHGVPCTLIPDNTGGHLMQNGMVDMVIVGTDRVAANGDVANKIGTYLKALAARDNDVPFYVAMPMSSFDPDTPSGKDIPIEERDPDEVLVMEGKELNPDDLQRPQIDKIRISAEGIAAANYGFDITPAHLVSGYISENGVAEDGPLK